MGVSQQTPKPRNWKVLGCYTCESEARCSGRGWRGKECQRMAVFGAGRGVQGMALRVSIQPAATPTL